MSRKHKVLEPSQRQLRVGELLRHELAQVLVRGDVREPVLQQVTVTVVEVSVSPDLRKACVYVMPLAGEHLDEVLAALERASKFLRGRLAQATRLKYTPRLEFRADTAFDYADGIDRLLHRPDVARDLDG
ncbi:MAG TPA: 30S ribosome-binding factor RbfA [Rhodobacteraceae bacterium]|nr:30S ribosome-binding factor RbfA [Paracoccaceae bacterium]